MEIGNKPPFGDRSALKRFKERFKERFKAKFKEKFEAKFKEAIRQRLNRASRRALERNRKVRNGTLEIELAKISSM